MLLHTCEVVLKIEFCIFPWHQKSCLKNWERESRSLALSVYVSWHEYHWVGPTDTIHGVNYFLLSYDSAHSFITWSHRNSWWGTNVTPTWPYKAPETKYWFQLQRYWKQYLIWERGETDRGILLLCAPANRAILYIATMDNVSGYESLSPMVAYIL